LLRAFVCFTGEDQVAKFQPGQSGNPKGRPKKERSLTALLEKASDTTVTDVDGNPISGKRLMAQYVWEALTTGSVLMPNGYVMHFDSQEWLTLAKWVYGQIDGPPKQDVEISGAGGGPIEIRTITAKLPEDL
jgi:hypothetical protein